MKQLMCVDLLSNRENISYIICTLCTSSEQYLEYKILLNLMKACPLSCRCLAVAIETNVTNAGMYISLIVLMKFAQCESKFLRKTF